MSKRQLIEQAARRSGCLPISMPTIFALAHLEMRNGTTAETVIAAIRARRPDLWPRPDPPPPTQVDKFRQRFGDYRPPKPKGKQ